MFKACMDSGYGSLIQHSDNLRKHRSINTPDLLATIFAMGCNLGLSRASIITGRNENDLDYISRWYLSKENIDIMNDKVVELITKLSLPNIDNIDDKTYTASDGSHVVNRQATFKAKHSYKYGGSIPASSQYLHIDHRYIVFYSTMISASAQEAPNVIDGLLHSKWIKSDIHSTDTFGSTEPVFGLCYLLGFDLVPRIKNLFDVKLYSFDHPKNCETHTRKKHWKIKPVKKINTDPILSEWGNLLHLATSVKLEYCSASTILKRLNSYSRKNRLYLALRESLEE